MDSSTDSNGPLQNETEFTVPKQENYLQRDSLNVLNSVLQPRYSIFNDISALLLKQHRNHNENMFIASYLAQMDNIVTNLFQGIQDNHQLILYNMSNFLSYEKIPKNKTIFRYGDDGDKFYLIFQGKVEVLIPHIEELMLNDLDYLMYLINLRKYGEISLLRSSIEMNNDIFPILESFDEFVKKFRKEYFYLLTLEEEKDVIDEIFKEIEVLMQLNNSSKKISSIIKIKNEDEYYLPSDEYVNNLSPKCLVKKSRLNKFSKKIYKVWVFSCLTSLKEGDKFGEKALLANSKGRTATIITVEETHLGILNKENYNRCLKDLYEKIKNKNVFFLLSTPIFRNINHRLFEKNNYNNFIQEKAKKNTKIIQENSPLNSIYFLKEGEFEVKMKKSLVEINELIIRLGGKLKNQKDEANLRSSSSKFESLMNKKMTFRLFIVKNSDILGLEEFPLESNSFYTVETLSNTSEFLKIDFKIFNLLFMKDYKISENTKKFSDIKRNHIIQRITKFKEMRIQIFLTQNQFLLYEVFPMQYKQEIDFKKGTNLITAAENKNIKRDIEINLIERYKSHKNIISPVPPSKSEIEKSSVKKIGMKISLDNVNSLYNTRANLKTYTSERCITRDKSSKNFKKLDLNNFIKEKANQANNNNLFGMNVNNTPTLLKFPISTKNINVKSPLSFKISAIKNNLNCDTENFSDYLTTEKSMKKENKILDCLTMDNFNRSYNTNFYFSKNSNRRPFSSRRLMDNTVDPYNEQIKIENNYLSRPIKTFEYLITQDTIQNYNTPKPFFYTNPNTLSQNFTKKILQKKYVIKSQDSYSSVCVRSKSKRNKNIIDFT